MMFMYFYIIYIYLQPIKNISYPIELIRTPVPSSEHEQHQHQICNNNNDNDIEESSRNVNRQLFSSPPSHHPLPPPPSKRSTTATIESIPIQNRNNHQPIPIQLQNNIQPINNDNYNFPSTPVGKMLHDIEFGGLTNFVTYVSKDDQHDSFLSKEMKSKLLELRKTAQSIIDKIPFNVPSSHYYYQDVFLLFIIVIYQYNPVLVEQLQNFDKNQTQPNPVNVTHPTQVVCSYIYIIQSPLLTSMQSSFVEDKNINKKSNSRKDSFGNLANFFSIQLF